MTHSSVEAAMPVFHYFCDSRNRYFMTLYCTVTDMSKINDPATNVVFDVLEK